MRAWIMACLPQRLRQRGTALLELALVMPFLALLLLGVFDLGRAFADELSVTAAARAGARAAVVTTDNSCTTGVRFAVMRELNGTVAINCPADIPDPVRDATGSQTVRVVVNYHHPLLFGLLDNIVPGGQLAMSASATMPLVPGDGGAPSLPTGVPAASPTPLPTFTNTATRTPTNTPTPPPTSTPVPTNTAVATATKTPAASPTRTAVPTSTPANTPTQTPLPPSPTPTPCAPLISSTVAQQKSSGQRQLALEVTVMTAGGQPVNNATVSYTLAGGPSGSLVFSGQPGKYWLSGCPINQSVVYSSVTFNVTSPCGNASTTVSITPASNPTCP